MSVMILHIQQRSPFYGVYSVFGFSVFGFSGVYSVFGFSVFGFSGVYSDFGDFSDFNMVIVFWFSMFSG